MTAIGGALALFHTSMALQPGSDTTRTELPLRRLVGVVPGTAAGGRQLQMP
jgi:hypothetical protein